MKILHLLGASSEVGGIISCLLNIHHARSPGAVEHVLWVNENFEPRKTRLMSHRYSRFATHEPTGTKLAFCLRLSLSYHELIRLVRHEHFDVIHGHHRSGIILNALLRGKARSAHINTYHMYANNRALYRRISGLQGMHTVYLTPNMASYYGLDTDRPQIRCISECCPDDFFSPEKLRIARSTTPVIISGVGTIELRKKWHLLLQAILLCRTVLENKVFFRIYGMPNPAVPSDATYHQALCETIRQNELESIIALQGQSSDILKVIQDSDWFVAPSTNEPCSVALVEALATGLPALVSASGGNVDIIKPGTSGLLFKPDDPADLARALIQIAEGQVVPSNPAAIRATVLDRSARHVADAYESFYRDILV